MGERQKKHEELRVEYLDLEQTILAIDGIIAVHPYLTHKDFKFGCGWEWEDPYVRVEYERNETDEEMNERVRKDQRMKKQMEASRKLQYEALKKEFEK